MSYYDHGDQPIFSFLLNADWYSATNLQALFKSVKDTFFDRLLLRIYYHVIHDWSSTLSSTRLQTPPFNQEMRFQQRMLSIGGGKAEELYICQSFGGWASLLSQLWGALAKAMNSEVVDRDWEDLISIVDTMEEKMGKMEGVFNRHVFEEQFKFQWVDPSNVTACSK